MRAFLPRVSSAIALAASWAALHKQLQSLLSIAAAIGVQYVIMHHVYPNAPRQVSAFQLVSNLKSWLNYFVVVASLFPW